MSQADVVEAAKQIVMSYAQAVLTYDVEAYTNLYTDDAYWAPPDSPDKVGKEEIRAEIQAWFNTWEFEGEFGLREIRALSDSAACVNGFVDGKLIPRNKDPEIKLELSVFWLIENRDGAGWAISNQFWNINPSAGAAPAADA